MDNLRIHKNPEAVSAIEATGASVEFQPRYSPEFNAIEHCWSWIKHHLRNLGCRAIDQLVSYAEQTWRRSHLNYASLGRGGAAMPCILNILC
jgi:transposase